MASTFAEKNQEFAKSTTDNAAQSGKKKKQSPFQGMYYGASLYYGKVNYQNCTYL